MGEHPAWFDAARFVLDAAFGGSIFFAGLMLGARWALKKPAAAPVRRATCATCGCAEDGCCELRCALLDEGAGKVGREVQP